MRELPPPREAAIAANASHFAFHATSSGYLYFAYVSVQNGTLELVAAALAIALGAVGLFSFDLVHRWLPQMGYRDFSKLIQAPLYLSLILAFAGILMGSPGLWLVFGVVTAVLMSPSHRVGIGLLEGNYAHNLDHMITVHSFWGLLGIAAAPLCVGLAMLAETIHPKLGGVVLVAMFLFVFIATRRSYSEPSSPIATTVRTAPQPASSALAITLLVQLSMGELLFWFAHASILYGSLSAVGDGSLAATGVLTTLAFSAIFLSFAVSVKFPALLLRANVSMSLIGCLVGASIVVCLFSESSLFTAALAIAFLAMRIILLDSLNHELEGLDMKSLALPLRLVIVLATVVGAVGGLLLLTDSWGQRIVFFLGLTLILVANFVQRRIKKAKLFANSCELRSPDEMALRLKP